jgi:hypothetical protein
MEGGRQAAGAGRVVHELPRHHNEPVVHLAVFPDIICSSTEGSMATQSARLQGDRAGGVGVGSRGNMHGHCIGSKPGPLAP